MSIMDYSTIGTEQENKKRNPEKEKEREKKKQTSYTERNRRGRDCADEEKLRMESREKVVGGKKNSRSAEVQLAKL